MKIKLILIIIVFFKLFSYGQTEYFKYKNKYSFPIFYCPNAILISEKINQIIQLNESEFINRNFDNKYFYIQVNTSQIDTEQICYKNLSVESKIYENTNRILSIKFLFWDCCTRCHYWSVYYNFNSQNGDLFQLKDIFSEDGYEHFKQLVSNKRLLQYEKEFNKLNKDQKQIINNSRLKYDLQNQWSDEFYISHDSIYIDVENLCKNLFKESEQDCASHMQLKTGFKLNEYIEYLNEYGKALFGVVSLDSLCNYHTNTYPLIFEGKIGKSSVILLLQEPLPDSDNAISGTYIYTKYRIPIKLNGSLINQQLKLVESNNDSGEQQDVGIITAKFINQEIIGTWISVNGEKKLKLILKRK